MQSKESGELADDESAVIAERIREELARRRMSRQRLADAAKISISTLEKALGGSRGFTLATLVRIEEALGIVLRPKSKTNAASHAEEKSAPPELGAYARAAVKWLEGSYLTLRPSFEIRETVFAYRTEMAWDGGAHCLAFRESERLDAPFSQKGVVSIPNKSGHIYLYTNDQGQMRLAILGRPLIGGEMYGLLTTLQSGAGAQLLPVATPLALIPLAAKSSPLFGRITPKSDAYAGYRKYLTRAIAENFVRLIAPSDL
jgi:transcriptional regulator with XRE-family HTH domain